jgi:two-component system LytT family sensor kinase
MRHPVLTDKVRLIIWWLVWLFLALGQSLIFYFAYGKFTYINIVDSLVSLVIYSGIALSLWYPFSFFSSGEIKAFTTVLNLIFSGTISIFLWVLITRYVVLLLLPENNDYQAYWNATIPYRIGTGAFIFGLIVLSYFLFISLSNLSEKKARESRLESLVRETELKMLRSQINPHFLFNSLNSISSLTITDPGKARTMIVKLSEFMRYALSRKDEQPVPLHNELESLRLYLDIEKVRFGDRLTTDENIDKECLNIKIPGMLLQPLYENAIKHGVYESTETVRISTSARLAKDFLEITIMNNFDISQPRAKGTGTGLMNVARRLELTYGQGASLRTSSDDGVFTVKLFIPA